MGYIRNQLDNEAEFDLEYVQKRIKYLSAVYMNRRSKKPCTIKLRAWFPGPVQSHQFTLECTRPNQVIEKTRVQPIVWEAMTKNQKTDFMGNGVEFFTIKEFNGNEKID
jgi:hypothetical protein